VWCGVLCSAVVVLWRVGLREGETDALSLMSACVPRDLLRQLITLIPYFDGYGMRCMYLLAL